MAEKTVSELISIVRAGGGLTVKAAEHTVDDLLPIARAASESGAYIRISGALHWKAKDLVRLAEIGQGHVSFD